MLVAESNELTARVNMRGAAAMYSVGELVVRMAGGEAWDASVIAADDEVFLSAASAATEADLATLRAELRLQRFAGVVLPHVNVSLSSEDRRSLIVVFGNLADRTAILRVRRGQAAKPFATRECAPIERFFRHHSDTIMATFDEANDDGERIAARREAPMTFVLSVRGEVLAVPYDVADDADSARAIFMPQDGRIPPVLAPVIAELLERARTTSDAATLVGVLPYATVRLTPMRREAGREYLVAIEWLRSRASLEVTAAHYAISKRELQVLASMLRGSAVATIAAELSISESTVVFHLKRMLKKTSSKNRTELAARMLGWDIPA